MTRLLTIDPGAKTGIALFQDGKLVYSTCLPIEKALALLATPQVSPDLLVIEIPRVYSSGRQPVDPNDLVTLAVRAGRLIQATCVPFTTIWPSDWKAQVPDEILYNRIRRELSEKEREVALLTKHGKSRDMLDAIGIGLVQLGRVRPGIVRRTPHAPESPGRAPEASHRPVATRTPTRASRAAKGEAPAIARAALEVPPTIIQAARLIAARAASKGSTEAPAAPADAQGVPRGATRKPRTTQKHE